MIPEPYKTIHKQCSQHREQILASKYVGCFSCCQIFCPNTIEKWTDNNQTAFCPKCKTDALLPHFSGNKVWLLHAMYRYYFDSPEDNYPNPKLTEPYSEYTRGLELALKEIYWKIDQAALTNSNNGLMQYHDSYIHALSELSNTLKMYRNQARKNERPGLYSTVD